MTNAMTDGNRIEADKFLVQDVLIIIMMLGTLHNYVTPKMTLFDQICHSW